METGYIKIDGDGTADNLDAKGIGSESEQGKIKILPPMPDQAIEYGAGSRNPLEDIVSELAEPANLTYEVSDVDDESISVQDAIVTDDSPEIVDVAEVVTAPDEKEFIAKPQNALSDDEDEGGVAKAKARGPTAPENSEKFIKPAQALKLLGNKQSDFNPGTVQNALEDERVEGGIISAKSTGPMISDGDAAKDGFQDKGVKEEEQKGKYRVYGFAIQYRAENGALVTKQVSNFFDYLEIAKAVINGRDYLMPDLHKAYQKVSIVSGVPEISFNDRRIYRYNNDVWTTV
jgi:hypothetical protein